MLANQFKLINKIGEGAYSNVYLVQDVNSEQLLACKIMKEDQSTCSVTEEDIVQFIDEANI